MAMLFRRQMTATSDNRTVRDGLRKTLWAAAVCGSLMVGCRSDRIMPQRIMTQDSHEVRKHEAGESSVPEPQGTVSFQEAKENPALRQAYLDGVAREMGSECVARLVYDPDAREQMQRCKELEKKYRKPETDPSDIESCEETTGGCDGLGGGILKVGGNVFAPSWMIGKQEKADINLCPGLFEKENEEGDAFLAIAHENTHACDRYHGIRIGDRVYKAENLQGFDLALMKAIIEVRAYGNQLQKMKPEELNDDNSFGFAFFFGILVGRWQVVKEEGVDESVSYAVTNTINEYSGLLEKIARNTTLPDWLIHPRGYDKSKPPR